MTRNEVIAELMKLRQRCARLKCSSTGKTEEWARSEDALGFAINALRHMQYGGWIFHPDRRVKNWGEIVCSKCGMPIAFGGEWALQKAREKITGAQAVARKWRWTKHEMQGLRLPQRQLVHDGN